MINRIRVLVVDDDECISEGTQFRLRAAGCEALTAINGQECIDVALLHLPDVIVMDVRMPIMDGLEALKRLKAMEATRHIPVIMLSASVVDNEAALESGARFFIRKPFDGRELIDAIKRAASELQTESPVG